MKKNVRKPVRLTYRLLKRLGASQETANRFRTVFPRNTDLTVKAMMTARRKIIPLRWLMTRGMTSRQIRGVDLAIHNLVAKVAGDEITPDQYDVLFGELVVKYIRRALSR